MHFELRALGTELPAAERRRGRDELDRDRARLVRRFDDARRLPQLAAIAVTGDVAEHVVQRHQREAERKAAGREQPQLPRQLAIRLSCQCHHGAAPYAHRDEADIEHGREQREPQRRAPHAALAIVILTLRRPRLTSPRARFRSCDTAPASSASTPGRAACRRPTRVSLAFAPARIELKIRYANSSCDRPKPNAPIEEIMFQSANCVVVVGDAARHAGEAEEVLREEQHVDEDRRQPEVHLRRASCRTCGRSTSAASSTPPP